MREWQWTQSNDNRIITATAAVVCCATQSSPLAYETAAAAVSIQLSAVALFPLEFAVDALLLLVRSGQRHIQESFEVTGQRTVSTCTTMLQ